MKSLKKTLIISALMVPGVLNAALLRFDVAATDTNPLYPFMDNVETVGLLDGSYFVVDTSVTNSSSDPTSTYFSNSIVSGHIEAYDPEFKYTVADITDARQGSITASNDGINTTWEIIADSDNGQTSTTLITFAGTDLFANLQDSADFYRDNYLSGTVTSTVFGRSETINFTQFEVSDVTPAPVPLPPAIFLMASALGMMLWRSNLSVFQKKQLLTTG